jgi:hypothetical protein
MKTTDRLKQYLALQEALRKERAALEKRLAQIKQALSGRDGVSTGPAATRPRPRRGKPIRNKISLREAINQVTRGRALTKREILTEVQRLGYRFAAKDPMNSLNAMLYSKGQFRNRGGKFSPAQ